MTPDQVAGRGILIYQWLAGRDGCDARRGVGTWPPTGKVSGDLFAAINKNAGGAAKTMGNTFQGR